MLLPYWFDQMVPKEGLRLHAKIIFYVVLFVTAWNQKPIDALKTAKENIFAVLKKLLSDLLDLLSILLFLFLLPVHLAIYLVIGLPLIMLLKIKFVDNIFKFILHYKEVK